MGVTANCGHAHPLANSCRVSNPAAGGTSWQARMPTELLSVARCYRTPAGQLRRIKTDASVASESVLETGPGYRTAPGGLGSPQDCRMVRGNWGPPGTGLEGLDSNPSSGRGQAHAAPAGPVPRSVARGTTKPLILRRCRCQSPINLLSTAVKGGGAQSRLAQPRARPESGTAAATGSRRACDLAAGETLIGPLDLIQQAPV